MSAAVVRHLMGLHDPHQPELHQGHPGWCVVSVALDRDEPQALMAQIKPLQDAGVAVIVRLNHSYAPSGTIPEPSGYADFARRCAQFVTGTAGISRWVVGNEPNLQIERPHGAIVHPDDYARCYRQVRARIRGVAGHGQDQVILAAIGPWNIESGDWLGYFRQVLEDVAGECDGLALHTYSRGAQAGAVTATTRMDAPFDERYNGFLAYRDLLSVVPSGMRHLPVYLTETDPNGPWPDDAPAVERWMRAALAEIAWWNSTPGHQAIACVVFYRWQNWDAYGMSDRPGVADAVRRVAAQGILSPAPGGGQDVYLPVVPGPDNGAGGAGQRRLYDLFVAAAQAHGLDPLVVIAQSWWESSLRVRALGGAGEYGLMQILPSTWQWWAEGHLSLTDPWDPAQNVAAGVSYLAYCGEEMERAGRTGIEWALAAYNGGPGRVGTSATWQDVPAVVRTYAANILRTRVLLDLAPEDARLATLNERLWAQI